MRSVMRRTRSSISCPPRRSRLPGIGTEVAAKSRSTKITFLIRRNSLSAWQLTMIATAAALTGRRLRSWHQARFDVSLSLPRATAWRVAKVARPRLSARFAQGVQAAGPHSCHCRAEPGSRPTTPSLWTVLGASPRRWATSRIFLARPSTASSCTARLTSLLRARPASRWDMAWRRALPSIPTLARTLCSKTSPRSPVTARAA
mmetsp:Transcript_26992/g.58811  ORF Transcript_26992/g.58811 Transcript_26992/m.58811 type:complete len:203 (-) Transcript_26992:162-770(-)